jgi:hypothetical protein
MSTVTSDSVSSLSQPKIPAGHETPPPERARSPGCMDDCGRGCGFREPFARSVPPAPDHVRSKIDGSRSGPPCPRAAGRGRRERSSIRFERSVKLYAAELADGAYCAEIVTPGDRGRGVNSRTSDAMASVAVE